MTKLECHKRGTERLRLAEIRFKAGWNEDGWVNLLAAGMDLAASRGEPLNLNLETYARDAGLIQ